MDPGRLKRRCRLVDLTLVLDRVSQNELHPVFETVFNERGFEAKLFLQASSSVHTSPFLLLAEAYS